MSTATVHLPDGHTAEICDVEGISGYAERVVLDIMGEVGADPDKPDFGRVGAAYMRSQVEMLPYVIKSWSYPKRITLETVMRLPRSARKRLVEATADLHAEILKGAEEADDSDPNSLSSSEPPERPS